MPILVPRISRTRQQIITNACKLHWERNKSDCNSFVRAVANSLGINLSGDANSIYRRIHKTPWVEIGEGRMFEKEAGELAEAGLFVIAASQGERGEHGHVAVVTGANPKAKATSHLVAYWGRLNTQHPEKSIGKQNAPISASWRAFQIPLRLENTLETVYYAYQDLPSPWAL